MLKSKKFLSLVTAGFLTVVFAIGGIAFMLGRNHTPQASVFNPGTAASLFNANGTVNATAAAMVLNAAITGSDSYQFFMFPQSNLGNGFANMTWRINTWNNTHVEIIMSHRYRTATMASTAEFRTMLQNDFNAARGNASATHGLFNQLGVTDWFLAADRIWIPTVAEKQRMRFDVVGIILSTGCVAQVHQRAPLTIGGCGIQAGTPYRT